MPLPHWDLLNNSSRNSGGNQDVEVKDCVQVARLGLKTTVLNMGSIHKGQQMPSWRTCLTSSNEARDGPLQTHQEWELW